MKQFLRALFRRLLLLLVLALIAAALGAVHYFHQWLTKPLDFPASGYNYQLTKGSSLSTLAHRLQQQHKLAYPRVLLLYARFTGMSEVRAGDYRFDAATTPVQLLAKLHRGDVVHYQVTTIEGWTFAQTVHALAQQPRIKSRLAGKTQAAQLAILNLPIHHPEGWFFPDTYSYTAGTTDVDILRRAYHKMRATLDELWAKRVAHLPYTSPYQALIMASIVERETGAAAEREKIAGVFVRRLQKHMRLQTDPTVIYGMGRDYHGKITRADLQRPTPYNTYTIRGLPPTPIAMPGREAIYASLHPDHSGALYFVAKGDGTHVFSQTLAEHNRAVRHYQLQRKQNYRSTVKPLPQSASSAESSSSQ